MDYTKNPRLFVENNIAFASEDSRRFVQEWVKDLESGKYGQTKRQLSLKTRAKHYDYCCLGVGCLTQKRLYGESATIKASPKTWRILSGPVPYPLDPKQNILRDLTDRQFMLDSEGGYGAKLYRLNDHLEKSFKEIAQMVRENLPVVFDNEAVYDGLKVGNICRFIHELRTTKREQITGRLFQVDSVDKSSCGCCATGLASLIFDYNNINAVKIGFDDKRLCVRNDGKQYLITNSFLCRSYFGLEFRSRKYQSMNDRGQSFAEIADAIQQDLVADLNTATVSANTVKGV
jgi:hypothetical protein